MKVVLRIDPTRCRGHGMCALMFPDGVELDNWGYGRCVDATARGRRAALRAVRAVRACPNDAISCDVVDEPTSGSLFHE